MVVKGEFSILENSRLSEVLEVFGLRSGLMLNEGFDWGNDSSMLTMTNNREYEEKKNGTRLEVRRFLAFLCDQIRRCGMAAKKV